MHARGAVVSEPVPAAHTHGPRARAGRACAQIASRGSRLGRRVAPRAPTCGSEWGCSGRSPIPRVDGRRSYSYRDDCVYPRRRASNLSCDSCSGVWQLRSTASVHNAVRASVCGACPAIGPRARVSRVCVWRVYAHGRRPAAALASCIARYTTARSVARYAKVGLVCTTHIATTCDFQIQ